jgi:putative addiction module antidote
MLQHLWYHWESLRIAQQLTQEAVMLLSVKKRGNSLSVIIPKEMATSMNVDEGDSLFATKTPSGYEISPYDPDFVKKIETARRGMKKYRNALIELAK